MVEGFGVRGRNRKQRGKGASSLSGPDQNCHEPLWALQKMGGSPLPTYTERRIRGWMGRQRGRLRPGALGLLVPAFPRLRSTRPTVSRVRGGTWPPVREFGMDFWQGQTQAQAWICWGERQVRHVSSPCPTGSSWGPLTRDLSSLPTPCWPWRLPASFVYRGWLQ